MLIYCHKVEKLKCLFAKLFPISNLRGEILLCEKIPFDLKKCF